MGWGVGWGVVWGGVGCGVGWGGVGWGGVGWGGVGWGGVGAVDTRLLQELRSFEWQAKSSDSVWANPLTKRETYMGEEGVWWTGGREGGRAGGREGCFAWPPSFAM